jgi:hypothetical protein
VCREVHGDYVGTSTKPVSRYLPVCPHVRATVFVSKIIFEIQIAGPHLNILSLTTFQQLSNDTLYRYPPICIVELEHSKSGT